MRARLLEDQPSGLASMLAALLGSNLERRPERARLLRGGVVRIEATDAEVSVLLRLGPGEIQVADGGRGWPTALGILASGSDLLELGGAPLRLGLPDPLRPEGRALLRKILRGEIRVRGMLAHPILLRRVATLLSVR